MVKIVTPQIIIKGCNKITYLIQISYFEYHLRGYIFDIFCNLKKTRSDAYLWTCGQCGLNHKQKRLILTTVSDKRWKFVSCGEIHTVAIDENESLWACGNNQLGQCGLNSKLEILLLTKVSELQWKSVTCSQFYTMEIDKDDWLWCCGFSDYENRLILTKVLISNVDTAMNSQPRIIGAQTKGSHNL